MNKKIFLVIDPGREKSGIAILDELGTILEKKVFSNHELVEQISIWDHKYVPFGWIIGNKGAGKGIREEVERGNIRSVSIIEADEHRSSEEGRMLYWTEHPPRGWKKIIPQSFLVPPEPWDDWAAVVIGRRWLKENMKNNDS